ncbi:MAG: DsbE family thiol:disulfide interchange protein [Rhodospirillaceae bacterium]|nr:DsbE family thiol:disulfide interchange protein [Rhodospirillaceae bacterium]
MPVNQIQPAEIARPKRKGFDPGRFFFLLPLAAFAGIAVAFAIGLTLNPREIPSALIGKEVPEFELPPVQGRTLSLSDSDLKGEVSLVNVFASWCVECKVEHPILMQLAREDLVPIHGLNYKDKPDDAANWLDTLGDPYTRTGADISGRVAIDWGVYGVPETFVVDQEGRIVYKHIGAMSRETINEKILPLIAQLRGEGK